MGRTHLFYRAQDFGLYLFSLAIVAVAGWYAFSSISAQLLLLAGLLYLAVIFVRRRGWGADFESLRVIVKGTIGYPARVARTIWTLRHRQAPHLVLFFCAIAAELTLRRSNPGSPWLRPFPFLGFFAASFVAISAFRTWVFVAHLRKVALVRTVLEQSTWRRELRGIGTWNQIVHGYVTGLVSNACLYVPALIFWRLTEPTLVREATLFFGYFALLWIRTRGGLESQAGGRSAFSRWMSSLVVSPDVSLSLRERSEDLFKAMYENHEQDHQSRFHFTVFHGHHHDALPSAVMASAETGLVEAIDRGISYLTFIQSSTTFLILNSYMTYIDMLGHQYIPGVFPYSRLVVQGRTHHVAHHYGSLRPLGLLGPASYKQDLVEGYQPRNGKVTWFLEQVRVHEPMDDAALERFSELDSPQKPRLAAD